MLTLILSPLIIVLGIMQLSISMFFTNNQIKRLYILGECEEPNTQVKVVRQFFKISGLSLATFGILWGLNIIPDKAIIFILILFAISLYIFTNNHKNIKFYSKRKDVSL